ncbi:Sec1-like protein [Flagelloscypha sp. PMI_526]|nr:Sec1-like protein [Flagelloscypha sp. PMI_526]
MASAALKQATAPTTLQQAQTRALLSLLNLNQATELVPSKPGTKNILVLDQHTKDVLATVLRVQDLRDVGVTLHVQLHSTRPALPDVPAVYFVSGTMENIKRISDDLDKQLYESFHLNFVEPLPRALLEELGLVSQVVDQYLSFIAPSPSLFSILPHTHSPKSPTVPETRPPSTYALLNSPSSTEVQIEAEIERIAAGLFSAIVTTGQVPFIRAPRGNAAEMVAQKVDTKLRDALLSARGSHSTSTPFSQEQSGLSNLQRPLLLILDRNIDLTSMISHGWTYQALVSDCLEIHLNRVTVPGQPGSSKKALPEEIDAELNKYKQDAAEITRSTGVSDVNDIAQILLEQIKKRSLDELFSVEEAMNKQTLQTILEFLRAPRPDSAHGSLTPTDKLRLVIMFYLSAADGALSKEDTAELEKELQSAGADIRAFEYVKRHKEILRMTLAPGASGLGGASTPMQGVGSQGELFKGLNAISSRFTNRLAEGGLENLISGVKNFLPTNKSLPVTRLTEALMDSSAASNASLQETDEYIFLDPRASKSSQMPHGSPYGTPGGGNVGSGRSRRMAYNESVVFVVGGAGYVEYGNLEEWAKKTGKRVTYGGTEIVDPGGFIGILESLEKDVTYACNTLKEWR